MTEICEYVSGWAGISMTTKQRAKTRAHGDLGRWRREAGSGGGRWGILLAPDRHRRIGVCPRPPPRTRSPNSK